MSPPLINEYKRSFAYRRLIQSFAGGTRFVHHPILIAVEVVLFLLPDFALTPTNILLGDVDSIWKTAISTAVLLLVLNFANFIISFLKFDEDGKGKEASSTGTAQSTNNFLEEEDQEEYEGLGKPSTWHYLAPNAKFSLGHFVLISYVAVACSVACPLLFLKRYNVFLRAMGMFAVCTSYYSTGINAPSEVATFDPGKKTALLYTRPTYVLLVGAGYWLVRMHSEDDTMVFSYLLGILPFLWTFGILPSIDALVPWILEFIVRCLGGSPSIFYFGSFITILCSLMVTLLAFVAAAHNRILLIPLECVFGYIMTLDMGCLMSLRSSLCEDVPARTALARLLKPTLIIWTSVTLITISSVLETQVHMRQGMVAIVFILALSSWLLRKIFIVQKQPLPKSLTLTHTIWDGLLSFVLHLWFSVELHADEQFHQRSPNDHTVSLSKLIEYSLAIRGFATAITEPKRTAVDLSIASLIIYFFKEKHPAHCDMFVYALFYAWFIRKAFFRFLGLRRFMHITVFSFLSTTLLEHKWKYGAICLAFLPISMASLVIATLIEGTTLIPAFTLPIFVVGFQRPASFWKRTWFPTNINARTITGSAIGKGIDWTLYAQLAPVFVRSFVRKVHKCRMRFTEGDSFLARFEDRILFLRVVSCGWNYVYVDIKGLEMQEQTSCHHLEAASIDEVLEAAFGRSKLCSFRGKLTHKLFGSLEPFLSLNVPTYEESKSTIQTLTAMNDIEIFRGMFFRAFAYLWIKKNPVFQGESYKRPVASSFPLGSMPSFNRAYDDSDDEEYHPAPAHRPKQRPTMNNNFNFGDAIQSFTLNVSQLPGVANGVDNPIVPIPTVRPTGNGHQMGFNGISHNGNWHATNGMRLQKLPYPPLPGMSDHDAINHNSFNAPRFAEGDSNVDPKDLPGLNSFWVKKCVGETIPSNAVKNRVEKLCWKTWTGILGRNEDIYEIDLCQFFEVEFYKKARHFAKTSTFGNISIEETTLKAFRYASKLTLDEIFAGGTTSDCTEEKEDELFLQLSLFEKSHKFCMPQDIPIHIDDNQKHIFSMRKLEHGASELKILNFISTGVEFRVGSVSKETLYGIWANLGIELLYLTSDDDERLSIQNDVYMLRNISTQCANAPLGYPVYDSMFRVNLFDKVIHPVG